MVDRGTYRVRIKLMLNGYSFGETDLDYCLKMTSEVRRHALVETAQVAILSEFDDSTRMQLRRSRLRHVRPSRLARWRLRILPESEVAMVSMSC